MDVNSISNVVISSFWGFINYIVYMMDGSIWFVPNDPNNRDYAIVQEWLALNGGN